MVIPEERDGKLADDPSEARETDLSKSPSSGRKAGGQEQTSKEQQKVHANSCWLTHSYSRVPLEKVF